MSLRSIDESSLGWMPKEVWGPIKWKELHTRGLAPFAMDNEEEWFEAFVAGLPCPKCRKHFEDFLARQPPDFISREAFFRWTVQAHNFVNEANGKRHISVEEAKRVHECRFE